MMSRTAVAVLLMWCAPAAWAQNGPETHTTHVTTGSAVRSLAALATRQPVRIDGVLNEAAWAAAASASGFIQQSPRPGAPAQLDTEVRVLIDESAVTIAVRAHDPAPDSIVAQLARRDAAVHSDWIYVALDSYGDRRSAYQFGVNAAGVKHDARITDDTREDASWDAVWDAATRVDEHGWSAELRIPLAQLRYRTDSAEPWRFNVKRVVARHAEVSHWAPVPSNAGRYVSSFGELTGIAPTRAPRGAELTPYLSSRVRHDALRAANPYHNATEMALNGGFDVRLNLGSALNVRATVNPDFGQVESDPSSVNLTAYELFYPERRPFFVEGSEFFRNNGPTLFYSRRIGRAPQGSVGAADAVDMPEQATLLGAARLTGQTGGWSVGVLEAVTARETARFRRGDSEQRALVEPATNYTVARVTRDFAQGRTRIGAIATGTHRMLAPGELPQLRRAAYAGGVDLRHRFANNWYELSGTLLASHVRGDTAAIAATQRAAGHYFQRPDAPHLEYNASRRSLTGSALQARLAKIGGGHWRAYLAGEYTSPQFEVNDLGYHNGADRVDVHSMLRYIEPQPGRRFRSWIASFWTTSGFTTGGERIDVNATAELMVTLHNHWSINLWGMRHSDGVRPDALRGGPALYHPARWMGSIDVGTDQRRPLSASFGVFRDRLDQDAGGRTNLYGSLQLRPSARMDLSVQPSVSRYRYAMQYVTRRAVSGEDVYLLGEIAQRTAAASVRLNYTFTPALSLQLYAQPYLSSGEYSQFKQVADAPRSSDVNARYELLDGQQLSRTRLASGMLSYGFDRDGDGVSELRWNDPSYDFAQARSTAVLRWEFRPASTLFLVWTRERTDNAVWSASRAWPDASRVLRGAGPDALMLKVSYWIGR